MDELDNKKVEDTEEINYEQKKEFNWRLTAAAASLTAFLLLLGIWYLNNERAFLSIENNRLKAEMENLEEEIVILQDAVAQKENQARETEQEEQATETGTVPETDTQVYTVKPGDTLTAISVSLFGTENYASQIAELNGLSQESILQVGQTLKVPDR